MKISWIGPWISRIDWCEGHWCGSTSLAMRLSDISSITGKKCIFCAFRPFTAKNERGNDKRAYVYVPALNLRTVSVMNFIPVFNDYATFRVKLVMVFIQDICDISAISKNCNCDIWMGRSTGNNWFVIFMHILNCSYLRFNFKVNQVVFIINK